MNTTNFILTNRELYTREDAYKTFGKYLDDDNMRILADHICHEELSYDVFSFTTQNDVLFLNLGYGGDLIAVTKNEAVVS